MTIFAIIPLSARCEPQETVASYNQEAEIGQGQRTQPEPTDSGPDVQILSGMVVEKMVQSSEGEKAGLAEGDILLRWYRGDSQGAISSPFDVAKVEIEQAPRGVVKLEGLRGTKNQTWTLGPDAWGIQVRPRFSGTLLPLYLQGRASENAGSGAQAEENWRRLTAHEQNLPPWLRPWLLLRIAQLLAEGKQWKEADQIYEECRESAAMAGSEIQGQVLRDWARSFERRSNWPEAEKYFQQALAQEFPRGEDLVLALDFEGLGNISRHRGDLPKAEEYYARSLEIRQKLAAGSLAVAWSMDNLGNLEDDRGALDKSENYYSQALAIQQKSASGQLVAARSLMGLGDVAYDRGDLPKSDVYYRQALEIKQRFEPDSLNAASTLNSLGNVAYRRGDLAGAEEYYRRALQIKQAVAPGSLNVASSLANLGNIALEQGDLTRAEEYYQQDLQITGKLAPGSLNFAGSLMDLGIVMQRRGDLDRAEDYYRQALEIKKKLAPESLDLAFTLNNLGSVAQDRRDLAQAGEYYRQSLELREKFAPDSLDVAAALGNLGEVALARGDLDRAEKYYRKSLLIKEKLAPGGLESAADLDNLGMVYWQRADFAKSEGYCMQALEIREKLAPESLATANSLDNLGAVAWRQGNLPKAEEYLQRALALRNKLAPESVDTAGSLNRLAGVMKDRGDLDHAEQYYRRASDIWAKLAPASADQAEAMTGLAFIARQRRQDEAAAQLYEQALQALEGQTAQLGGSDEARARFRSQHLEPYREYLDLLVTQNKPDLALMVLESSRARMFLETLRAAHVDIRKGADRQLLEQEHTLQTAIGVKSDRRLRLLEEKNSDQQSAALAKDIGDLESQYQDVEERLRRNSPGYAALTQPQPLKLSEIQQLLDSNTVLFEYSLGAKRSYVFAVTSSSLAVYSLPERTVIEGQAKNLYQLLTARNHSDQSESEDRRRSRIAQSDAAYREAASKLSLMLLGPLAAELGQKRLVIVSDGALRYVPFAALAAPSASGVSADNYVPLMVQHEIAELPSASVLRVLREERNDRRPTPKQVMVLADPVFEATDARVRRTAGVEQSVASNQAESRLPLIAEDLVPGSDRQFTRSLADLELSRDGKLSLPRLPFSRREATAILALTPKRLGTEALDFAANRKLAMSGNLAQYRIVHFATHALVDNEHPELSGLVLSLVDEHGKPQQGFLDLQDVYNLDLGADLVVLSACETALGKQIDGEGMIGLTRGFMYAGAPRVVGTLWQVQDFATANFMRAFYKAMEQDRMPPAQALRSAQLKLWQEKHWSAPYYWAAFSLQGDWK